MFITTLHVHNFKNLNKKKNLETIVTFPKSNPLKPKFNYHLFYLKY